MHSVKCLCVSFGDLHTALVAGTKGLAVIPAGPFVVSGICNCPPIAPERYPEGSIRESQSPS